MSKRILAENVLKNLIILVILYLTYGNIESFLMSNLAIEQAGNLLVAVSILAVTACFGNFAFTYECTDKGDSVSRLVAHMTTGLLMLVVGISLEMTAIIMNLILRDFWMFNFCLAILYAAIMLYDFWDLSRLE